MVSSLHNLTIVGPTALAVSNSSLYDTYLIDATLGNVTITLEDISATGTDGIHARIIRTDSTSINTVTISGFGGVQNINSGGIIATTLLLSVGSEVSLDASSGVWYGQVIKSTTIPNRDTYIFNSNGNLTDGRFLQTNGQAASVNEPNGQYLVTSTFTSIKFVVKIGVQPGGTATRTFVVRLNGVDTIASLVISSLATTNSGTFAVNFASGDLISVVNRDTGVGNPAATYGIVSLSLS